MSRRLVEAVAALALACGLAACGSSSSETASSAATSAASTGAPASTAAAAAPLTTGSDGCDHATPARPAAQQFSTPPKPPFAGGRVVFETSCGTLTIQLDPAVGGAVESAFAGLVAERFYDGLSFHRIVPDFVVQGGDPTGTGAGGPGFSVAHAPPASYAYQLGDVAMAKTEAEPAGTAGSQFFIVTSANGAANLGAPPPLYAVVGHVLDAASRETLARLAALGTSDGPPSAPVYVVRARLERG
jgi:peptidyl-prolyl cis-trans isomerase B (cyclophilin B)